MRRRYHDQYSTPEKMGKLRFSDLSVIFSGADYASVTGAFHLTRPSHRGRECIRSIFAPIPAVSGRLENHTGPHKLI